MGYNLSFIFALLFLVEYPSCSLLLFKKQHIVNALSWKYKNLPVI